MLSGIVYLAISKHQKVYSTNKLLKKFFSNKANWSLESFENIEKQNENSYKNPVAINA